MPRANAFRTTAGQVSVDGDNVYGIEDSASLVRPEDRLPCEILHRWPLSLDTMASSGAYLRGYDACVFALLDTLAEMIARTSDPKAMKAWELACARADGVISEILTGQTHELLVEAPGPVAEWIGSRSRAGDSCLMERVVNGLDMLDGPADRGRAAARLDSVLERASSTEDVSASERRALKLIRSRISALRGH